MKPLEIIAKGSFILTTVAMLAGCQMKGCGIDLRIGETDKKEQTAENKGNKPPSKPDEQPTAPPPQDSQIIEKHFYHETITEVEVPLYESGTVFMRSGRPYWLRHNFYNRRGAGLDLQYYDVGSSSFLSISIGYDEFLRGSYSRMDGRFGLQDLVHMQRDRPSVRYWQPSMGLGQRPQPIRNIDAGRHNNPRLEQPKQHTNYGRNNTAGVWLNGQTIVPQGRPHRHR